MKPLCSYFVFYLIYSWCFKWFRLFSSHRAKRTLWPCFGCFDLILSSSFWRTLIGSLWWFRWVRTRCLLIESHLLLKVTTLLHQIDQWCLFKAFDGIYEFSVRCCHVRSQSNLLLQCLQITLNVVRVLELNVLGQPWFSIHGYCYISKFRHKWLVSSLNQIFL